MNEVNDITKKEKRKKNQKYVKVLKLYIVPLFSIIIFVGIIVGFVFPKVSDIFSELDEITSLNEQITQKNQTLSQLSDLSSRSGVVLDQLAIINSIAPTGTTEVVEFRNRATELSTQNGLEITSQRFSEIIEPNLSNLPDSDYIGVVGLQEVPSEFKMSGSLVSIKSFLQALDSLEDFVVVKEMKLTYAGSSDFVNIEGQPWTIELQIVKYQFSDRNQDNLTEIYQRIPLNAVIDERVQEYIDARQQSSL